MDAKNEHADVFDTKEDVKTFAEKTKKLFSLLDEGINFANQSSWTSYLPSFLAPDKKKDSKTKRAEQQERNRALDRVMTADLTAMFPVYGVVKSGKSTFLSCIMRESLLPAEAMPMTTIPIKVKHVRRTEGGERKLHLPQCDKWNTAVKSFRNKILAGEVLGECKRLELMTLLKLIEEGTMPTFKEVCYGEAAIKEQLYNLSHFIRLAWSEQIDLETDFGITVETNTLPVVEMTMRTFVDFQAQEFAFLDTPGPNEANGGELLEKMGPKIVSTCCGCIAVIPWSQVNAEQMVPLYVHLNKWMRGKTVVIIISMWDGFRGKETERKSIIEKVKEYFPPEDRPTMQIFTTSGGKLHYIYRIEDLMQRLRLANPEAPATNLKDNLRKDKAIWKGLPAYYEPIFTEWDKLDDKQLYDKFAGEDGLLRRGLRKNQAAEIFDTIKNLYLNSSRQALRGHFATVSSCYADYRKSVVSLKEFSEASDAKRQEMQTKLENLEKCYVEVRRLLKTIPKTCMQNIESHIKGLDDELNKWANSQTSWHIREIKSNGECLPRTRYIKFHNGKAELELWWISSAKGQLLRPLRAKIKASMARLPASLGKIVTESWCKFDNGVDRLKHEFGCEDDEEVKAITRYQIPEVLQLPEGFEKTMCDFSKDALVYDESKSGLITFDNKLLNTTILKEFKNQVEKLLRSFKHDLNLKLDLLRRSLEKRLKIGQQTLHETYERNKKLMTEKLSHAKIVKIVGDAKTVEIECERLMSKIEAALNPSADKQTKDSKASEKGKFDESRARQEDKTPMQRH